MSSEEDVLQTPAVDEHLVRSYKSWNSVIKAIGYYEVGQYERALPHLLKYQNIEPTAMICLASMFVNGQGVVRNMEIAASYLLKLVKYGSIRKEEENLLALAHYFLGEFTHKGVVSCNDASKAVKYWKKGAVLKKRKSMDHHHVGTVKCQTALGMFYLDPKLNKTKKALYWHKRAADAGSIISEGALGFMYLRGIGTDVDMNLAYDHLAKAAVVDDIYAKGYLTAYYYKRQIFHRAVSLGRELAHLKDYDLLAEQNECDIAHVKQGIAVGCFYLAMCLQYGYAAEKNMSLSKALMKKALDMSTNTVYDLHEQAILGRM